MNLPLKLISGLLALIGLINLTTNPLKETRVNTYAPKPYVISHGQRDKKVVALTFDADMTPKMKKDLETGKVSGWYNKKVIEILEKNNVPATLFLSGMWIEIYPKETAELAKSPLFELANHSYSHPSFSGKCFTLGTIPENKDEEEISKTQKILKEVANIDNHFFRFPGGCYDKDDVDVATKLGLNVVGWDVSGNDGFNQNTQSIVSRVLRNTQNGSIVVLHLHGGPNAPKTAEALPFIISGLRAKGFSFVKVSELSF